MVKVMANGPVPGMLKWMRSRSPASAFESVIAWRSEPVPALFVLVTKIVRPAGVTDVCTTTVLSNVVSSPMSDETPAVMDTGFPIVGVAITLTPAAAPGASVPRLHVMIRGLTEHAPCVGVAEALMRVAGSVNVNCTFVAETTAPYS